MAVAGIDMGSLTTKVVIMEDGKILSHSIITSAEEAEVGAEKAMEQVRQLEMKKAERGAVGSGLPGQMHSGQPPPKQVRDQPPPQPPQQDLAQAFSQLTSAGYKPSNQSLVDSASKAHRGPVELSGTWLANLFIKILRAGRE